ncbi:IclR family transcriptional regulator domain-containing protein [Ramlibacter sp. MMS24-I3-19]|uniref:IclR family transcriptional regulator domain-containing protein n=1 Tax=Ramlibacter sp. MMS24-I3-19 TaxID=3416606 RepID=UPI003CFE2C7A
MRKLSSPALRQDKDFVASLQKGLDVLTCFGRGAVKLTLSEVARRTGSSPASARRSLHTLLALDYLESDGKRFWVAPRALLVAHAYLASRPIPQLAQPLLDALSERTRQSASLGKLLDDDVIIVARSTARRSLSTGLGIGSRLPAYCSALGRVVLASLSPSDAAQRVRAMRRVPLTPKCLHEADDVIAEVERCRARGWSANNEELELGVRSIAVPVHDRTGAFVGGLSISVRAERMPMGEFRDSLLPVLQKASLRLGEQVYE